MDHFGRIDILVYNAGGAKGQNIFDTSDEDWEEALTRLVKLVAPIMSQLREGRIIAISSIFGRETGGRIAYNSLKAALISLTKSSDLSLGRFGRPEEVAAVIILLSSRQASLVSGACIPVDGAQPHSSF